MKTCPVCNEEFELSKDQIKKAKYRIGYQPTCSAECRIRRAKLGFNNRI